MVHLITLGFVLSSFALVGCSDTRFGAQSKPQQNNALAPRPTAQPIYNQPMPPQGPPCIGDSHAAASATHRAHT
jgi:hypothetical protein